MDTNRLKRFAQEARSKLLKIAEASLDHLNGNSHTDRLVEIAEKEDLLKKIQEKLDSIGKETFKEEIAYTWFNRFIALRFMDLNEITEIKTVSSSPGHFQPEILEAFKEGHCPDYLPVDKSRLYNILNGTIPSRDPQNEVYRNLLLGVCNYWHEKMPFMFEKLHDYTELLMPGDLLSEHSILAEIRENITDEDCKDVEIIGWLYQFYISEKKEAVIGAKQKIKTADIPAATQLFTPHWIVRYLVENSLGRLWMMNNPDSELVSKMDYYINPEEQEQDFLKISSPEEIRICDPACGSGHMLTYAFDLLTNIYEEQGYDKPQIPRLILENSLYGMEIDQRAASLAAFALTMKAREYDRRFFRRDSLKPNILCLEKVSFSEDELKAYKDHIGEELYTPEFEETLLMFDLADNAGSLLQPKIVTPDYYLQKLASLDFSESWELRHIHEKVLSVLSQVEYLSRKYHCVVANPPYMGNMNDALKSFAKKNYPDSKSDLFAMFIERNLGYSLRRGYVGMITMQSWMFLSSFEKLRASLLDKDTIISMAHLGARAFDTIGGEVVSTTSFILENSIHPDFKGSYLRLVGGKNEASKIEMFKENLPSEANLEPGLYYCASASDFKKIPGSPIAYWVSDRVRSVFEQMPSLSFTCEARQGLATADNNRFLRLWWENQFINICFSAESKQFVIESYCRWFPYNKGGEFRKWYGNHEYTVNWENNGKEIKAFQPNSVIRNPDYYFQESVSWSDVTCGSNAFRYYPNGFIFDSTGHSAFIKKGYCKEQLLALSNNKFTNKVIKILNPTMHFHVGYFKLLPAAFIDKYNVILIVTKAIRITKIDWDSYETSWDFTTLPLLQSDYLQSSIKVTYANLRQHWREMTQEMQRLEEENNRIFIEAYGLEDELTPDVPLEEITLTCNPHYRYGVKKSDEELEVLLLADTMKEFISYAVGCMFGRYSLDKPGLILANQGETLEDYIKKVGDSREDLRYMPDEDNVIPITEGEYFEDDIVTRFKQFLRVAFGDKHYEENLAFIENAIGKDIRKYFLIDFYKHHVRLYKKRPIYWLFSSPKKTFNALIYMHRYQPDTVSVVLNDYLREFVHKLEAHISNLAMNLEDPSLTSSGRGKLQREIEELKKKVNELKDYEREVVYPIATERIEIDLDDGVKVNYAKFGKALARI